MGRNGPVSTTLEPPIPGFPVVRLSATSNMGAIRVMHPTEKKQRRQRWRRRHSKDLPLPPGCRLADTSGQFRGLAGRAYSFLPTPQ